MHTHSFLTFFLLSLALSNWWIESQTHRHLLPHTHTYTHTHTQPTCLKTGCRMKDKSITGEISELRLSSFHFTQLKRKKSFLSLLKKKLTQDLLELLLSKPAEATQRHLGHVHAHLKPAIAIISPQRQLATSGYRYICLFALS